MNKYVLMVFFFIGLSFSYALANPFSDATEKFETSRETISVADSIVFKITIYQQNLKQRLSVLINDFKIKKSFMPLFFIFTIAFFYGVLHAAGPGHGKVFAAGYIMSQKPSFYKGLLFGNVIGLFHGLSGAGLVLFLDFVLKKTISGSVADVEYITKLVSYSLLSLLGLVLLCKSLYEFSNKNSHLQEPGYKNVFLWGFSAGIIPCPGVIMIMLFCLSLGMPLFGFIISFFVSLGMALTISFVVSIIVLGKKLSYGFISGDKLEKVESFFGFFSGFFVLFMGALFLYSLIKTGKYFI